MMEKAYFFWDVVNIQELQEKTYESLKKGKRNSKFCILESINLPSEEFYNFTRNFMKEYRFITPYRDLLHMNKFYEYVCLSVTSSESDVLILVNSSGYSNARNVAVISKK